jgi:hypothetical protein
MNWLAAGLLVLSGGLLYLCLRRRGRNISKICSRCGGALAGRSVCPVCSEIQQRRAAVSLWQYFKRLALCLLALLLATPGVAWLTSSRVRAFYYSDWEPHKPTFWVIHDLESRDQDLVQGAVDELAGRLKSRSLSRAEAQRYIGELLLLQTGQPPKHLTDIFQTARDQDRLTPPQWEQYWRQAFPCELHAQVIAKDVLAIWLELDQPKVRYADPEPLALGFSATSLVVGSRQCETTNLNWMGDSSSGGGAPSPATAPTRYQPVRLVTAPSNEAQAPEAVSATVTFFISYPTGPFPSVAKFDCQLATTVNLPNGTTIAPPDR